MVQTANVRYGFDPALAQNWPCRWRIFVQRQVSAGTIVIVGVGAKHAAQVLLTEYDKMIQTFSSDRSDQPFDIGVLPGRSWCRRAISNTHGSKASPEDLPIGAVAITDEIAGRCVPRKGLRNLTGYPVGRWMRGDSHVQQSSPSMAYDEKPE